MGGLVFTSLRARNKVLIGFLLLLTACGQITFGRRPPPETLPAACGPATATCPEVLTPDEDTPRPRYRAGTPPAGPGFVDGVEAATLDATTEAEKQAALNSGESGAEKELGQTIAGLGDVSEAGFWLKTPLVLAQTPGRVVWADSGESVRLTLLPKQGARGSASQISLAAMRALGIPLTVLPKLTVFAQ
jgi:hypothetical protein